MSVAMCAVCGAHFSARSDALYCSSACRQKAHRTRTAQRIADLSAQAARSRRPTAAKPDQALSGQRVRDVLSRSQELCLIAAEHMRQAAIIAQRGDISRTTGTSTAEAAAATVISALEGAP
jgi:hypothetical protein